MRKGNNNNLYFKLKKTMSIVEKHVTHLGQLEDRFSLKLDLFKLSFSIFHITLKIQNTEKPLNKQCLNFPKLKHLKVCALIFHYSFFLLFSIQFFSFLKKGLFPVYLGNSGSDSRVSYGGLGDSFYEYLLKQYVLSNQSYELGL